MQSVPSQRADQGELLVDHVSPQGPRVTHLRGILLVNVIANLHDWGLYERYMELLDEDTRGDLQAVIASSWVPVELVLKHYEASARLDIEPARSAEAGQRVAERIARTFLGITLRGARGAGLDALGFLLRRNGRTWDRMYQGGGTRLWQLAPKEMLLEDYGHPLFRYDQYRHGYHAYWRAIAGLCCTSFSVTDGNAGQRDPTRMVTRFSWR